MDNILLQIVGRKRVVLFDPSQIPYLYLEGDKSKVIDIDDLESTEFPQFQRAVRNEGMLYPGDVLYIPVAIYCGNTLSDDKELTEENGIYSWSIIKLLSRVKEPSAETLVLRKGECLSISRSFRTMSIYNLTTMLEKVSSVHRKMMADAQCARRFLTVVPQLKQDSLAWGIMVCLTFAFSEIYLQLIAALRDWMLMSFFLKSENVFSIGDTHPAFISAVYAMSSTLLERVGKRSTPLKGITFSLQRIDENQPDIQYEPGIAQLLRAHNLARGLYRQNILQSPHRRANQNRQSTPPNTNQQSVTGSQQFTRDLLSDALRQARERTFESQMEMLRDLGFHNDEENAHFLEVSNGNLDLAVNLILAERERMTMD
ncbi:hypothetical protein D917_08513 [Trichinella nativa]|uniref:UBA domain-containing protein n=1 Tax=Trichinella nativa TaxID=6335 RepID=A0A1Y3EQG6_9BILA|nr:hypothetical protein D917_08513 [Trichinella nativa]